MRASMCFSHRLLVPVLASLLSLCGHAASATTASVTAYAVDPTASETGPSTGAFEIRRTGDVRQALTVRLQISGTAGNGTDIKPLPTSVTLPAGSDHAEILVTPIDDKVRESDEDVRLTVLASAAGAATAYEVGTPASAEIVVRDNDSANNLAPAVELTSPKHGIGVLVPTNLVLTAEAKDRDGTVKQVEFYADGARIATDTKSPYAFTWNLTTPGEHKVYAIAVDDLGAATTSSIVVFTASAPVLTPKVTVEATDARAYEGEPASGRSKTATFAIQRSGNTNGTTTVGFAFSGTATQGADYSPSVTDKVVFKPGIATVRVVITPKQDTQKEATETIVLTLQPATDKSYTLGSPLEAKAQLYDDDTAATNKAPEVSLALPIANLVYPVNLPLLLTARATDPESQLSSVEFFVDDQLVGKRLASEALLSPLNYYSFLWASPSAGQHRIRARATDTAGLAADSAVVAIQVGGDLVGTTVTLEASDSEVDEASATDAGTFVFKRSGDLSGKLTVRYQVSGSASNGVDFVGLPGTIAIPAGESSVKLAVTPLDDRFKEGDEIVTLMLAPGDTSATSGAGYVVGTPKTASITFHDDEAASSNQPPTVSLLTPTNSSVFPGPATILVWAEAADRDGRVTQVEFYVGDRLLQRDTQAPFTFIWTNVAVGQYTLQARAADDQGMVSLSEPVRVSVVSSAPQSPTLSGLALLAAPEMISPAPNPLADEAVLLPGDAGVAPIRVEASPQSGLDLVFPGQSGNTYLIEASDGFGDWFAIGVSYCADGLIHFTEPDSRTAGWPSYRARLWSDPNLRPSAQ